MGELKTLTILIIVGELKILISFISVGELKKTIDTSSILFIANTIFLPTEIRNTEKRILQKMIVVTMVRRRCDCQLCGSSSKPAEPEV